MIDICHLKDRIINGNCLELMKEIPDKSIDMILCDPPYGLSAPEWDKVIDFSELWNQYRRIIKKNSVIAVFSHQPFTSDLIQSNRDEFKYCWYWIKNQGTNFFHARKMPIRKIEEICIFYGNKYYPQMSTGHIPTQSAIGSSPGRAYYGTNKRNYIGGSTERYPTNVLEFKCVNNYSRIHSSEKPVDLCRYLIRTYTEADDLVLDNCIGSGTTAVAAIRENRRFIGIELDEKYFIAAQERIEEELANRKRE